MELLHRASVGAERVLVTGASGGVGSAAVQLAKRRGAHVVAVASATKAEAVRAIGADEVVDRNADLAASVGHDGVDVAIDLVAGASWPRLLDALRRGGRYATAGAVTGPLVELDVRTPYLGDLTLFGCTFQEEEVFENLVSCLERDEIRPLVAKTFPLHETRRAQEEFPAKTFTGKLVLIPPEGGGSAGAHRGAGLGAPARSTGRLEAGGLSRARRCPTPCDFRPFPVDPMSDASRDFRPFPGPSEPPMIPP